MNFSEPVILFFMAGNCGACQIFQKSIEQVKQEIRKVRSGIRVIELKIPTTGSQLDFNEYPKDLSFFQVWFPNIILFPGPIWDKATKILGLKNNEKLRDGAKVFNGIIRDDKLLQSKEYLLNPQQIGLWLEKSLKDPEFLKFQRRTIIQKPKLEIKQEVKQEIDQISKVDNSIYEDNEEVCKKDYQGFCEIKLGNLKIISIPK